MSPGLKLNTVADVAVACDTNPSLLDKVFKNPEKYYTSFNIPKSGGSPRIITPSLGILKRAQTWLLDHFNAHVSWSKAVHGGIKKRSIFTNAARHIGQFCVATMDIASFFPSTTTEHITSALIDLGCSVEASEYISRLTTFSGVLPQGAPTSTLMGNIVLRRMDLRFIQLAERHNLNYTRYVDDITVSGAIELNGFQNAFADLIIRAGFKLSEGKTRFQYRHKEQIVTGLIVNDKLRPTTKYVSKLRRSIRECWPGGLGASVLAAAEEQTVNQFKDSLWGKVNFLRQAKPSLYQSVRALLVNAIFMEPPDLRRGIVQSLT